MATILIVEDDAAVAVSHVLDHRWRYRHTDLRNWNVLCHGLAGIMVYSRHHYRPCRYGYLSCGISRLSEGCQKRTGKDRSRNHPSDRRANEMKLNEKRTVLVDENPGTFFSLRK